MTLVIISAEQTVFRGEVTSVTLPGAKGAFTVLHNHAALISTLVQGNLSYTTPDGTVQDLQVPGGLVDVSDNTISVCIY